MAGKVTLLIQDSLSVVAAAYCEPMPTRFIAIAGVIPVA